MSRCQGEGVTNPCQQPVTKRLWCPTWIDNAGPMDLCEHHARNFMPEFNEHSCDGEWYWGEQADAKWKEIGTTQSQSCGEFSWTKMSAQRDEKLKGKRWRSCARWPEGTVCGTDKTTDVHDTKEQAMGVCRLLKQNGFGGNGGVFPIRTWVEIEW